MPAAIYNYDIEQGETSTLYLIVSASSAPMNLTGYTAAAQIRTDYNGKLLAEYRIENTLGTNGTITGSIDATTSAALPAKECVYDLQVTLAGVVTKLIKGRVNVLARVTK
jgi:hypothetical protein